MKTALAAFLCCVLAGWVSPTFAQWQLDGTPVCTAGNHQYAPAAASDGAGGVMIAWYDYRSGGADIYVQRIDASGYPLWTPNGVAVCTLAGNQLEPKLVTDGDGGAVIVFSTTDGRMYAQRVDRDGVPLWTANGVAISVDAWQKRPAIVSDAAGGAIIAFEDYRGSSNDIYVQRVDADGNLLWGTGTALCTASGDQSYCDIARDGVTGDAVVVWNDSRNVVRDIYAQRVNPSGVAQWIVNGVAVCAAAGHQDEPRIADSGWGTTTVVWMDRRVGYYDVYAQSLNEQGTSLWTPGGVAICTAGFDQTSPRLVADLTGSVIVTWMDARSSVTLYAQRLNSLGTSLWTPNGVSITDFCDSPGELILRGDLGAIVTWTHGLDVYAQRVSVSGGLLWGAVGVSVSSATNAQSAPTIATDGKGGALVAWQDRRTSNVNDIYAQRVEGTLGSWGRPEPIITSVADVPGDNGGNVTVEWLAGDRDALQLGSITGYYVWRSTTPALAASDGGEPALQPAQLATWELVDSVAANGSPSYSVNVATTADSTSQDDADHYFGVWSLTSDPQVFWSSLVVAGRSVDNLAPAAPVALTAQRVGSDVLLQWNPVLASDLDEYAIYRHSATGVMPVPMYHIASAPDTFYVDASAPTSALYYVVTARDIHENQGTASNEASVGIVTGVGDTPAVTQLSVRQNYPNPFTGVTALEIGLPANATVRVDFFDVVGRRVASLEHPNVGAGWLRVPFSGVDADGHAMPSGVYLYRVSAGGHTVTGKMVLVR